ncbi:hypothetical protein GCM10018793_46850 [Streptomyces sulfonofaciens]|uniref:Uncharacterized protein n=1 Tax=Streptomyces sulfonofaciens TaxID=68272 RepID=A0A919GG74_9ACTN|nr:hypothetical protein GCM10018793_46850 [Streptomyces sulfonofaciens]
MAPEATTEGHGDIERWGHLDAALRQALDGIAPWLALKTPYALPHQLDKAAGTTRTMTVVGRALLPDSMRLHWGLASDFLDDCHARLIRLKKGLMQRSLSRDEAMALHHRVVAGMANFRAAVQQSVDAASDARTRQVGERLVATAEMLTLLLRWIRDSIEHIFDDTGCPTSVPVG